MLNSGKKWRLTSVNKLINMSAEGFRAREIGSSIGRSTKAVYCKRSRIRRSIASESFKNLAFMLISSGFSV